MSTRPARRLATLAAALLLGGGAATAQPAAPCLGAPTAARSAAPPHADVPGVLAPTPPTARTAVGTVAGAAGARLAGGGAAGCPGVARVQGATYDEAQRLVSLLGERWVPDAQAWVPASRSALVYSEDGRTTTTTFSSWVVATQEWAAASRTTTTTDANGNPLRHTREIARPGGWENATRVAYAWASDVLLAERVDSQWTEGAWRPTLRIARAYDEAGRATEASTQYYFASGAAVESGNRSLYAYDASGARTLFEYQKWSAEAQVWVPVERQVTSADGAETLVERWTEGAWALTFRTTRTPDGDRLTRSLTERWDADAGTWSPAARSVVSSEDADGGTVRTYTNQSWRATEQAWVNTSRSTYGYDGEDRQVRYRFETWSAPAAAWLARTARRYAYGPSGGLTEWTNQRYAADGGSVERGDSYLYAYDAGVLTNILQRAWDASAQAWADAYRWTYAYGLAVDAGPTPEAAPLALAVYPNPTAGPASLRLTTPAADDVRVEVYDALGRRVAVVHRGPAAAGSVALPLDAARLAPGVYTVRAVADGRPAHRTFTVVR